MNDSEGFAILLSASHTASNHNTPLDSNEPYAVFPQGQTRISLRNASFVHFQTRWSDRCVGYQCVKRVHRSIDAMPLFQRPHSKNVSHK